MRLYWKIGAVVMAGVMLVSYLSGEESYYISYHIYVAALWVMLHADSKKS